MNDKHLDFLLEKAGLDATTRSGLLDERHSKDAAVSSQAKAKIAEAIGEEALARLEHEWGFGHGRVVVLWNLDRQSTMEFPNLVAKARAKIPSATAGNAGWVPASAPSRTLKPRVTQVRFSEDGLHARINIVQTRSYQQESERRSFEQTAQVELYVPAKSPGLVRVFTNVQDCRHALREWHRWLFGLKIEPGRDQKDHYAALGFEEAHAHQVAQALGMSLSGVVGDHTSGRNGEVTFRGRPSEEHLLPLDNRDADVARQAGAPGKERIFNYSVTHPDGFVEHGRVNFRLKKKPAHLDFEIKTSRLAMEQVVEALLRARAGNG